jgi:hypothetical protein
VAEITMGKPLNQLGHPFDIKNVVKLDIPDGAIVHIDNFGLMKFTGDLTGLNKGDKLEAQKIFNSIMVGVLGQNKK